MKVSKSEQIVTYIKWRINSGIYKPNKKIPSEASLALTFNCARATVRKALKELKDEGYIVSRKAIGYFVSLSKNKLTVKAHDGYSAITKFQNIESMEPNDNQVWAIERLGLVYNKIKDSYKYKFSKTYLDSNNVPFSVLQSMVNTDVIKNIDETMIANGLSSFIVKSGIKIHSRVEVAIMCMPPQYIRIKLNSKTNEMVPTVVSMMKDDNDNIIEIAIQYYIPTEFMTKKEILY